MKVPRAGAAVAAVSCITLVLSCPAAHAQVLVGDPFTSGYSGWVDAFPARGGNWRLSLHNPTLMDTNNANPPTTGGGTDTGLYEPDVLIQNNFTAPGTYDLTARMRSNDDDLLGVVWNYQDPDNYFRLGIRQQPNSGNFGGTEGLSIQKVVGGVVTQIQGPDLPTPVSQEMINNRTPFNLRVAVSGTNYEVFFDDTFYLRGSDPDLAAGRKIGVQSWAQQADAGTVTPFWGTEVESISVTQGATPLYNQSFAARPVQWRPLVVTNAAGVNGLSAGTSREVLGNFGNDVNDPWIHQHSNGFLFATAGNTDFIGPSVMVNEPGSTSLTDYEMRTRMGTTDNDGLGVLVRVQDDDNFYRITLTNEATGTAGTRAPQGLSVQKVRNGAWTELFREETPQFIYTRGAAGTTPSTQGFPAFDLSVRAIGNTLAIQVIDESGNVFDYPLITDNVDPLLSGSVGLHTWGADNVYFMGYGGQPGPLVVVPEPSAAVLTALAALGCLATRRRRRAAACC